MTGPLSLVLASGSPRRRELLAELGLEFEIRPADVDESPMPDESPRDLAERLALEKARAVARPGALTLGSDTVVALGDRSLGKPADADEARRMLADLSGRSHEVWTAVALVAPGRVPAEAVQVERATVRFRALSAMEIDAYVASGEPFDRAGAYAIQGGAAGFVDRLEGEITTVVGLPTHAVREMLERFGRASADA